MRNQIADFITVRTKRNGAFKIVHVKVFCTDGDVDDCDEPVCDNIPSRTMADVIADAVAKERNTTVDGYAAPDELDGPPMEQQFHACDLIPDSLLPTNEEIEAAFAARD